MTADDELTWADHLRAIEQVMELSDRISRELERAKELNQEIKRRQREAK